jgi:hypothetical protein
MRTLPEIPTPGADVAVHRRIRPILGPLDQAMLHRIGMAIPDMRRAIPALHEPDSPSPPVIAWLDRAIPHAPTDPDRMPRSSRGMTKVPGAGPGSIAQAMVTEQKRAE